jgi:asparagine synthase (glutamine-hydrolysing)
MCGIFGFVGKRSRAESIDLGVAIKSLHHRGPDDNGTYFGVSKSDPDLACAFAHTRLSIIDLSAAGHQPMTTNDGRYTIVYNGEVYNFRELRGELQQFGCCFKSNCDTEVVLKAYVRWGKACVERLRGMFAFAIWDEQLGSLFIARDRLGIKPLYYTKTAEGLAFSSEVRALMNCGVAERRISRDGLNSYLAFGSAAEPFTIIENVLSLKPGCFVEVAGPDTRVTQYWSVPDESGVTDGHAAGEIKSVVRSAILSELEADVPVGVFLSGGIDSSAIVAIAASAAERPVHTFTVTFDETRYNEEKYAAEVASRYGCDHHQVHLSADIALSQIDSMFDALDQPSADGVNTYFVAKAAREAGLAVVLSGLGGDEVFAGYSNFRTFGPMLSLGRVASPVAKLLPANLKSPFRSTTKRARKMAALLRAGGNATRTYAVLRSMFGDDQVTALQPEQHRNGFAASESIDPCCEAADAVNLYSRLELKNYLRNTLLRDADTMSMASSLEVRVPFLDHLLVEKMLRTAGPAKLSRRVNKPLLVEAAETLPPSIYARQKMGFTVPLEEWLRAPFKTRVTELFFDRSGRDDAILDPAAAATIWTAFIRGERYMNYSRVWCLVALKAWCASNRVAS